MLLTTQYIWNGIKDTISNTINGAKNIVKNTIEAM